MAAESKLQRKIISDLKKKGWLPVKIILCNLPGFSDIIALKDGKAIFIEAKSPGEEAKPLQEYRHRQLQNRKFTTITIDSWEEYQKHKNLFCDIKKF